MSKAFEGLKPAPVWHYFDMITQIPRGSGNEAAIQEAISNVARERDLKVRQDAVGNRVICVPASDGCADWPTVVLQGHVDMVCEKNSDIKHDFASDPIDVVRDGDWITAKGTTLGADNGIAVATALALLDDPPEKHGPLELLFTVDEETGLTGATQIEEHMISGKLLLNLDSEEEGFVTIGCAGGGDTVFSLTGDREAAPSGWQSFKITLRGIRGGHSGIDILHNRGNALCLMARFLEKARRKSDGLRLISLNGGSKRNAIPREATALVAMPAGSEVALQALSAELTEDLKVEFGATDPNLELRIQQHNDTTINPFNETTSTAAIALLLATPSGVIAMNREITGLVETSNNLGVVSTSDDTLRCVNCSRSSMESARDAVRDAMRAAAEALGASVTVENGYPGWKPDTQSRLLEIFKTVHKRVTKNEPEVMAIHAGLECGILGKRFPGMDMISFGPDMEGVHAPGERLSIPSVQRFFELLKEVLMALEPNAFPS